MYLETTNHSRANQPLGDTAIRSKHPLEVALKEPANRPLLARFRKSMPEIVQLNLVNEGSPVIDLRVWEADGYISASSTPKGFGIGLDGFPKLVSAITRAGELLEALDLTNPSSAMASPKESENSPAPRVLVQFQKNLQEQLRIQLIYLGANPIADLRVFKYSGGEYRSILKGFGIQTRKFFRLVKAVIKADRQIKRFWEPGQAPEAGGRYGSGPATAARWAARHIATGNGTRTSSD
jgi:hypothetical protein